ncbi:MAG TPA: UDP-N-acetylglucosamine 2-epimerase (non-hydrolyzing) [Brevundimonas sp.]|uniref:non-hydrolyzing UDP-N-acetylglucosamine 2-epimerase n=1 Tax=Brevundimonas sp. TaxID=1871086 RepID=UPI0026240AC0|nr:UDP-N-acetylglucosamine 2-epimerase (non-hydrolyzing) [Brevundimonas sp.]HRO34313.1 UDP-N-acetylglucosamine 2-epimerase (non-hydrolyzing) [Brevundimonas sp.]
MKVAIVAGTRPEVIKMAPVHAALKAHSRFEPVWVSTEQQGELNRQALLDLGVTPDVRLAPPSPERSVGGRFAQIMDRLDDAFARIDPDMVLVQGDTSSTGAGAMAGFARRIPVGHVEAGLRTFDLDRPFPEEAWRCVVGQLAAVHFAPTQAAADNLKRAGVAPDRIHITGNTGIDTVRLMGDRITPAPLTDGLRRILVTLHRRENWETGLEGVLQALIALRDRLPDVEIVFVAHANPLLKERVWAYLGDQPRIRIIGPLDYPVFIAQLKSATLVLSDSGGVQEEAPVFGAPVLVLRESTERMEAVEAGVARLVGVDPDAILREATALMTNEPQRMEMVRAVSPFGDGHASARIARIMEGVLIPERDDLQIRAAV